MATFLTSRDDEETPLPTIPTRGARLLGQLTALTAAIAILTSSAAVVGAEPPPSPDPASAPVLPLDELGEDATLSFYGNASSLSVPLAILKVPTNVVVRFWDGADVDTGAVRSNDLILRVANSQA